MYSYESLQDLVVNIFKAAKCSTGDANSAAEVLLSAELRGINSHGLIRIKDYIELWQKGRINTQPKIKTVRETLSTAVIDGDNGLGVVIAPKAMDIAISKAKETGTAWVAVNNSNHYGIAGYYAMKALEHDMIGIAMTNANPLVAPTFSVDRLLGTNPIAVAIPTGSEQPFVADFATTPIARGKLAVMHKEGKHSPDGYIQDKEGKPSNDPNILTEGGAILPLGGDREHGSHKGYCLGTIVDIFSAVLSGANFGPFVPPQVSYLEPKKESVGKGLGHFFGVMRIDAFQEADEFKSMMDKWISTFKNAKPALGHEKVIIPGEPEFEKEIFHRENGIPIIEGVKKDLVRLCDDLNVEFSIDSI